MKLLALSALVLAPSLGWAQGNGNANGNNGNAGGAKAPAMAPGRPAVEMPDLQSNLQRSVEQSLAEARSLKITLPDSIKLKKETLEKDRQALRDSLRSAIESLGDNPSRRQVQDIIDRFKDQNKAAIAAIKKGEIQLRDAVDQITKDQASDAMKGAREAIKGANAARKTAQNDLKKALARADSSEEKKALLEQYREEQKLRHDELKNELKKIRTQVRGGDNGGDRRVDE